MAKLSYLKINGIEIKQLWYGLFQAVNESDYNMVYSSYTCANNFTYTESPSRDLAGNIKNDDIEAFYVPTATFNLGYVNADIYIILMGLLNKKSFSVEYYDYEIGRTVIRDMYMSENSLSALHELGAEIKGFVDVSLSFVSRKSYKTYYDLANTNERPHKILDVDEPNGILLYSKTNSGLISTEPLKNNTPLAFDYKITSTINSIDYVDEFVLLPYSSKFVSFAIPKSVSIPKAWTISIRAYYNQVEIRSNTTGAKLKEA